MSACSIVTPLHANPCSNYQYCSDCREQWNPLRQQHNTTHHLNYPISYKICDTCKLYWDPTHTQHNFTGHFNFPINYQSCGQCKYFWKYDSKSNCTCSVLKKILYDRAIDFIKNGEFNNKKLDQFVFVPFSCDEQCESAIKFKNGIKYSKNQNAELFLSDPTNTVVAAHGTPVLTNAGSIGCHSWNINLRDGQAYGKGEYFSTKLDTANTYSKNSGTIIISLIIHPNNTNYVKAKEYAESETWYIVENFSSIAFSYPIGILFINNTPTIPNIGHFCSMQRFLTIQKLINTGKQVKFSYPQIETNFKQFDPINHQKIIDTIINNKPECTITIGNDTYTVDLLDMEVHIGGKYFNIKFSVA
jgi:uncharacterized protein YlaI